MAVAIYFVEYLRIISVVKVRILLACYNGEEYISDFLDSVLLQTYEHWELVVRDDISTDKTLTVLNDYAKKYPNKIRLVSKGSVRLGPMRNFSKLAEEIGEEGMCYMFADQDDYWLPDKILTAVKTYESKIPPNERSKPVLIYTDLIVVNSHLVKINDSLLSMMGLKKSHDVYDYLVYRNVVTGCTCFFNQAAKITAFPAPSEAVMHDWWLAICVSNTGVIKYIEKKDILYRQHVNNVVGASNYSFTSRLIALFDFHNWLSRVRKNYRMARMSGFRQGFLVYLFFKTLIVVFR